jgi:tRNA threonylcarbamoyladenosine biosynthesis protein TsaE
MESVTSNNSQETEKLGFEFASKIISGDIICLYGDLGSGKTTFVQGLASGLGISERIISPTFVIVRQHSLENNKTFYHIDLYRLENESELQNIGLSDIFSDKNTIVLVEWAERLGKYLPEKRWDIRFQHLEKDKRQISIQKFNYE